MGATLIGEPEDAPAYPPAFAAPLVYWKETWDDEWEYDPELQVVSFGVRASSSQPATCEVQRRYGHVMMPFEDNYPAADRETWFIDGTWIKVTLMGEEGEITQFVGIIENEARTMTGNATPAGIQSWVASGGLRILQKQQISAAYFDTAGTPRLVNWIPDMNLHDRRGLLVGNRSLDNIGGGIAGGGGTYLYGGKEVWTHLQYVQYLVANFVLQTPGPVWTIAGQTEILEGIQTSVRFPEVATAAEMLRLLIPVRYGVDFFVKPTDAGFEITVFSLAAEDFGFGGQTMPANNLPPVTIEKPNQLDLFDVQIVETSERRVDKVEVIGKRIVVCGSLRGPNSIGGSSLVKKWSSDLETEYITPSGSTDPGELDKLRKREKFRDVYQHLGAPVDWDLDNGSWAVKLDDDGELATGEYQNKIRETLSWIPLKEGFDYATDPPTDNTGSVENTPDIKPPMAWVYDSDPDEGSAGYVFCHLAGIHVSKPYRDWGIVLDANPNHLLAKAHWTSGQIETTADVEPKYDYESTVATIAIESDHRIRVASEVPDEVAAGDGSVMTIEEDAEMWVLLAATLIDVDTDGTLKSSGDENRILRDDRDRLNLVLAGAMSRYVTDRLRAVLQFEGFQAWADMVGSILSVVERGGTQVLVNAPITSIEWMLLPTPKMVLKTGYA